MTKIYLKTFFFLSMIFLFVSSCKKDEKTAAQEEREKIMEIENLLRDNQWGFHDLQVTVKNEAVAPPLLAKLADEKGMVQPGTYDSYAIFGNNFRQLKNTYKFNRDHIFLDTTSARNAFKTIAGYYVLSTTQIRINPESGRSINFDYINKSKSENKFIFTAASNYSQELITSINNSIINSIAEDRPSDIANSVVDLITNNEKISEAIEQALYDLIHGKIDEITQSPEELSEKIAEIIVDKLGEVDWETILYNKILDFLLEKQAQDAQARAAELSKKFADKIEASIQQSDIYDVLLPIFEDFEDETLPVLSNRIANAVFNVIAFKLSEENVYDRIYPVWEQFTMADSVSVSQTADTIAGVVVNRFFDVDSITERVTPLIQEIANTSTLKLSILAQEIIDSTLIPRVAEINEKFPALDLDPDWSTVKPVITGLLTTLKARLGSSTVPELSEDLAYGLINIMDALLQNAFEEAIYKLQEIPPSQAATVVASWVTNLLDMAQQPVVDFIEGKLNEIFENFEAEKAALELSELIHDKVLEIFSEDNLYNIILPLLEGFQDLDMERIAKVITQWIIDADLKPERLTEEELIEKLAEGIALLIGNINPETATQAIVDLLLNSDLVEKIDGTVLKKIIEVKILELYGTISSNANAIQDINIVFKIK